MGISLVLCTESYPFDGASEQTFLQDELPYLLEEFNNVILIPSSIEGNRLVISDRVEVNESYASELKGLCKLKIVAYALVSGLLLEDLVSGHVRSLATLKKLIHFAGRAEHARRWLIKFLRQQETPQTNWLLYTYWWTATTMGFGIAKKSQSNIRVISRCHNVDLYEERHFSNYIPCRNKSLDVLDALFPDSDQGLEYLRNRYIKSPKLLETARLGVIDPVILSRSSSDGVFRVVSCSFLNPVKRVDLILRGLAKAGRMRGDQKIEWVHFGHGPMKEKILDLIKNVPSNVSVVLRGYTPNLMNFYGNNTVDVFINVSEYEGTPVSIMEAIACGIPIIATAVGGNVEIVSNRNGIYLPPDLTSAHIANALIKFIDLHYKSNLLREGSREVWNEKYNAESNFRDFTYTISSIFKVDTYDY